MKNILSLIAVVLLLSMPNTANALLIAGQDIITAPASVVDDPPGATNTAQQAFDEAQRVILLQDLQVDGGIIAKGTEVNSHMIFLNSVGTTRIDDAAKWAFDGNILGVMSDRNGALEVASSSFLGAAGTVYPVAPFGARGIEGGDNYQVVGNVIALDLAVTEPGDWVRVVTEVPEPASMLLLGAGLFGAAARRKKISA